MIERIHKVIAGSGFASRRRAEQLIRAGRVTVDGVLAQIGQKVDAETAAIEVDGLPLPVKPGLVHLLLYKPPGVVSTADDPQQRTTVVDLVASPERVYPVGRLDADSEGLLILTNDGAMAHRLTHPGFGVTKTYTVLVQGAADDRAVRRLADGVELDDGPAAALSVRIIDRRPDRTLLEIVMGEGRKREVRRMCAAVGHPVQRLVRIAIGPLRDPHLKPGQSRSLNLEEIRQLYAAGGASWKDAPPSE